MKKISYLIFLAVLIGIGTISFWLYVKYFQSSEQKILTFQVKQGDITESVKVRGKVTSKKEYDLGFAESGTLGKIFVVKSQLVKAGDPLVRLNLKEKESEAKSLEAVLSGKKASLAKLLAGYTKEDIAVSETKVKNAEVSLSDARKNLSDLLAEAYTISDNAVRNYADSMIDNARTNSPKLAFNIYDGNLKNSIESSRVSIESVLVDFERSINDLRETDDLSAISLVVADYLDSVRAFLNLLASGVNKADVSSSVTATDIDAWKLGISTARTNVNTAISNVTGAEEKWRGAKSSLELAQKELLVRQADSRSEDVALAEADIAKAESDLDVVREKINRSTIYAPADGVIKKISLEAGEVEMAGETIVSLFTSGNQIEADVSELDIVKITGGQPVSITLDAFPGQSLAGKVISVDPEELDIDGDTYYKVNFSIDSFVEGIRPGMSSDIEVRIRTKTGVLTVSNLATYKRDGKEYVKILQSAKTEEVEIKTGISDNDYVEILSGLNVGDEVVISAD